MFHRLRLTSHERECSEAFLVLDLSDVGVTGDEERDALEADASLRDVEYRKPRTPERKKDQL